MSILVSRFSTLIDQFVFRILTEGRGQITAVGIGGDPVEELLVACRAIDSSLN